MTAITKDPPLPESPYRGIESFRYIDQRIFSAREDETWDLLSNILIYRGVLLYGDSGSGKSSLVNAGLIPGALEEKLIANRLRIQPRHGKEFKIERISTESEDKPPYLSSAFIEEGSDKDEALSLDISLGDFWERLQRLRKAPDEHQPLGEPRPLLIFDQFEEFITIFEEALRGGETSEAKLAQKEAPGVQQAVLDTLTRLIDDDTLPVKLLFVFREDYLAKLNLLFQTCPDVLDQYVRLLPPRVEEAEKIIRAPFADDLKSNFIKDAPGEGGKEIPESLAKTIAAQLRERSESGFINLSELQIICRKLWESPDPVRLFEQKGGIQKILEDHWADVLAEMDELYDPAIALLSRMVTSSNTRNIISEPDLRDNEKVNFTPAQIDAALEALVDRNLVRREPRNQIYFYEIASEFLVPWIREKKTALLAKIEARKLAAEKRKRNLWIGISVLSLLLIVAVGLLVYALYLRQSEQQAQEALTDQKERLENTVVLLDKLTNVDPQERLTAVTGLRDLHKEGQLPPGLVPVILGVISKDESQEVSNAASYFRDVAAEEAKKKLKPPTTPELQPRAYIKIASDKQRARADKIAAALKGLGFDIPVYESVTSQRAPSNNQLRYYKTDDGSNSSPGAPDPNDVLRIIQTTDKPNWSAVALKFSSKMRPGHFEIWFADDIERGMLIVTFFNPQSNKGVHLSNITVILTPVDGGARITGKSARLVAPPGEYFLYVEAPGHVLLDGSSGASSIVEIKAGQKTEREIATDIVDR
ncbi:MAG TPA: hypothetical protein VJ464_05895 [Blastocatellia bacterium]|nr:hypothetical protein [Blastocatellia bacterium]